MALQANYIDLYRYIVDILINTGVTNIDFTGFEIILALGGDIQFSALSLNKIKTAPFVKDILGIYVRAGFHIGNANDDFVKTLHEMLVKDQVDIVDYLSSLGALDALEFGRRVFCLIEENELAIIEEDKIRLREGKMILSENARRGWYHLDMAKSMFSMNGGKMEVGVAWRKFVLDLLPTGSEVQDWSWNIETLIISAGTRLLNALDEWIYSSIGITSILTWLVKSDYWDTIDIQDFSTQVLKKALKGKFFMFLERMLAFGFWFDDSRKALETTAASLLASASGDKDVVDFLRRVGLVVDSVVDIKKGVFNFSAGVVSNPLTGGINSGVEASLGDSRWGSSGVGGSPKTVRPPSFGAARGGASRLITGSRR
ncbi:hypothetical protein HDU76_010265, partial [Blyttiomyces sp. JEL0837]